MTGRFLSIDRGIRNGGMAAILATALLAVSACTSPPTIFDRSASTETNSYVPRIAESFRSGGRTIPMEMMRANATGRSPAVVMLHGASGIGSGYMIYPYGGAIAERGIHAFVVDYYDGLEVSGSKASPAHFAVRERIIADAVAAVRARPDVDPDRVGIWGLSLGGFHALALAAQDPQIAAVVDLVGAMPQNIPIDDVTHMPPTLVMHGSNDRTVPPRRMAQVASMLDRIGAPFEVKLYVGEGHSFSPPNHADSVRRSAAFFDRYLNNGSQIAMLPAARR